MLDRFQSTTASSVSSVNSSAAGAYVLVPVEEWIQDGRQRKQQQQLQLQKEIMNDEMQKLQLQQEQHPCQQFQPKYPYQHQKYYPQQQTQAQISNSKKELISHDKNHNSNSVHETLTNAQKTKLKQFRKSVNKDREVMTLGLEKDKARLSEFLCFLRSECIEIFKANEDDVLERLSSKRVHLNQVGIRCRFCAHLSFNSRVGRSSNFPSCTSGIYQGVSMMIYRHFPKCEELPDEVREKYFHLKKLTKRGEVESRSYWIEAAKEKGLIEDGSGEMGIRLIEDAKQPDHDNSSEKNNKNASDYF